MVCRIRSPGWRAFLGESKETLFLVGLISVIGNGYERFDGLVILCSDVFDISSIVGVLVLFRSEKMRSHGIWSFHMSEGYICRCVLGNKNLRVSRYRRGLGSEWVLSSLRLGRSGFMMRFSSEVSEFGWVGAIGERYRI